MNASTPAWQIAKQILDQYAATGYITRPIPNELDVKFYESPLGQLALETPREKRKVKSAKFWLSFMPSIPANINIVRKLGKEGRNNKLNVSGSKLKTGFPVWSILVRHSASDKQNQFETIIAAFLGQQPDRNEASVSGSNGRDEAEIESQPQITPSRGDRKPTSPEEEENRRKKQVENGRRGEEIAFRYEVDRLKKTGCTDPEAHVDHIAKRDTGAGYDIRSDWNGEKRYIEVKASESDITSFFISGNEVEVLKKYNNEGWIYLVNLYNTASSNFGVTEVQNPGARFDGQIKLDPVQYKATFCRV